MERAPLDRDELVRWQHGARRALDMARLQAREAFPEWACVSAEQAAQLAVKGLLHGLGKDARGHDLVVLGAGLEEAGVELPESVAAVLRRLTRYSIATRYPDAHPAGPVAPHYAADDAVAAIAEAEAVLTFVQSTWSRLDA